ncbi:hypothetical protein ACFWH1_18790 [Streptomyces sp. NPDC127037]|uniref:hypothetical protein n=1 Tax=Streptomyces sp. NPDC127037 TaxID=3347113 RepID=UPI00365949D8
MTEEEIAAALDAATPSRRVRRPPVPAPAPRPAATSFEDVFATNTVEMAGGHLHWTGATGKGGTPVIACGGQVDTAYRMSFRWHHLREPEGNVRPTCDYPYCVAGGHLADRVLREARGDR